MFLFFLFFVYPVLLFFNFNTLLFQNPTIVSNMFVQDIDEFIYQQLI